MALARKGSRLINVDGTRYRWTRSPADASGAGIVAELADSNGQRMVTWVSHEVVISSWLVREAILHARTQGWQPTVPGPQRDFRFEKQQVRARLFERYTTLLMELCDVFHDRVAGIESVRESIQVGEYGHTFYILCASLLDSEPALTLAEFERLVVLGESLADRRGWVDLIVLLSPSDRARLTPEHRALAVKQITSERATNPIRQAWLQSLRESLQR